jgi:DDE superfamily endonuclease
VTELAKRLKVTETDASALVVPVQEPPNPSDPPAPASAQAPASPPFGPDGTERRVGRPHDPTEQTRHYSGKKKCHTVKHVLLINAVLTILFLSETSAGRTHDKRMADATPSP